MCKSSDPLTAFAKPRAEFDRFVDDVDEAVDLRFSRESSVVVDGDESENVKHRRIEFTVSMWVGVELPCKSFV